MRYAAKVDALADVAAASAYRSKAEEDWSRYGPLILAHDLGEPVHVMVYEPLTFNLLGGKYTPDFLAIMASGRMVFVEIKGSKKQPNYRDSRSKLRAAAALHPWFTFVEAVGRGESWAVEQVTA